jgi:hypothetical protein
VIGKIARGGDDQPRPHRIKERRRARLAGIILAFDDDVAANRNGAPTKPALCLRRCPT